MDTLAPDVRGHGLRPLRRGAGLPVRRIAQHLGVRESTVYNWEAGRARIPGDHLPGLASLLGAPPSVLVPVLRSSPPPGARGPVPPLRRLRRRTGLSQEAVARRIGTNRHRLGAWERGQVVPPLWAVRRLARAYGVPVARVAALTGVPAPRLLDPARWRPDDLPAVLATLRGWSASTACRPVRCGRPTRTAERVRRWTCAPSASARSGRGWPRPRRARRRAPG
jgi:transcriptional regulator with XRE-family HTH domain